MLPAILLSLGLLASAPHALAAQPAASPDVAKGAAPARAALSDAQIRQLEQTAHEIAQQALSSTERGLERYGDMAREAKRRVDDIADAALSERRSEVLQFLGLDVTADSSLYYFVSFNMPMGMLRAYAAEAMWAGGTLVVRGVPPGMTLGEFVLEHLQELVYDKGASANLSIDPRLFDAYEVTTVPAIVLSTERRNFECQGLRPVSFSYEGQQLSYDTCPPVDPARYWKMSGAVTSDYALRAFAEDGAAPARKHLEALAKGLSTGERPPREQRPFEGDWKKAFTPEELMAVQRAVQAASQASSAPASGAAPAPLSPN